MKPTTTLLTMALLVLTGCASIVSSKNEDVLFHSEPPGRRVTVRCKDTGAVYHGTTPFSQTLPASGTYNPYSYAVTSGGYEQTMSSHVNGWYFGNILFGGFIGALVVDPLTGAWMDLPDEFLVSGGK